LHMVVAILLTCFSPFLLLFPCFLLYDLQNDFIKSQHWYSMCRDFNPQQVQLYHSPCIFDLITPFFY
jgi:hypothetical protein